MKYAEKAAVYAAKGAWAVYERLNRISPNPSFTPKWSDKPLLKSYQKEKPPLGWPRTTDSLCPKCVPEIRKQILDGKLPHEILLNEKVGEIKAQIIERDGKILMVKDCPKHGHFEDVMSIDTEFSRHLEEVFPGRDIRAHKDEHLHHHGTSTVKYGRGAVLTIDLTNRCNMMCDPCFMDANQVGFVHELTWEEIKTMLDNAITIKPRRQMSVQFSGGEPTLSPYFLDAVRYARKVGYNSVQAATNGIEFAKSFEFAQQAVEAGMRYAYLQFDGIGNAANAHRMFGNLFDVLKAQRGQDRSKDFLLGNLHVVVHAAKDRWFDEIAVIAIDRRSLAAGQQFCAFGFSRIDVAQHSIHLLLADDRSQPRLGIERIAELKFLAVLHQLGQKFIFNFLLYEEA